MGGPHPAVAEIRTAVRAGLTGLAPGDLVLVACSGGADSLALAAALAFTAPRLHLRAGGVTVDHGLQPGSADRARAVAARLTTLGLDPVVCTTVTVPGSGDDLHAGPEAAARTARYQALDAAAGQTGAVAILLGHTLDDQAETVLLRLARGSGARSLAGMAQPPRPVPAAAAAGAAGHDPGRLCRAGPAGVGRPAQRRPPVHPGPGPARGAAGAGIRARPGGGRGAGPHRRAAA